jgi:hypothetical protein
MIMKLLNHLLTSALTLGALSVVPAQAGAQEPSSYAAIRTAKAKPGVAAEFKARVEQGAVPIVKSVPGFIAYYVVFSEDDMVTTVPCTATSRAPKRRIADCYPGFAKT